MSALGSYEVLERARFEHCMDLARNVRTETTGKWIRKSSTVSGLAEFHHAWDAAVLRRVDFDHSRYVPGTYLDVQLAMNDASLLDDESEPAHVLSRVFTAGFVFDTPATLPELSDEKISTYCRTEYADTRPEMIEALVAAHSFYQRGLAEVTPENLVVFVIR